MNQYEEAARLTGTEWCPSPDCGEMLHNDWQRGIVHFTERRQTKRGLYEYLCLAYGALFGEFTESRWRYLWRRGVWVQEMAAQMHRRLPRSLFDEDRARIREGLAKEWLQADPEVVRAKQWARRQ